MLNLTVQLIFYCRYLFPLYSKYSSKLIFRFSWTYCEVAPFYLNMFESVGNYSPEQQYLILSPIFNLITPDSLIRFPHSIHLVDVETVLYNLFMFFFDTVFHSSTNSIWWVFYKTRVHIIFFFESLLMYLCGSKHCLCYILI